MSGLGYTYLTKNDFAPYYNNMSFAAPAYTPGAYSQNAFLNSYWGNNSYFTQSQSKSQTSAPQSQEELIKSLRKKAEDSYIQQNQSVNFLGITKQQEEIILKQHSTKYEPKVKFNSLGTLVASQVAICGVMTNANLIKHPLGTAQVALSKKSATNQMFKNFVTAHSDLWKANSNVLEEAYYTMHKMEVRSKKFKWFSGLTKKKLSGAEFDALKGEMQRALSTGNIDEIAQATERLKYSHVNNGLFPRAKGWIKGKLGGTADVPDVLTKLNESKTTASSTIATSAQALTGAGKMTFGKAWKRAVGGPMGKVFALFQFAVEIPNVITAFKKDTKTGLKQSGQSLLKAGVAWGSWTLGEAGGVLLGAKLGAAIGSVCPGLGTAIGAVAGVVGGLLVSTFATWGIRKLVGDNVVNEVKSENLAKTDEGRLEIVQELMRQAEAGEIEDKGTLAIVQKMTKAYEEQLKQIQQQQSQQTATQVKTA